MGHGGIDKRRHVGVALARNIIRCMVQAVCTVGHGCRIETYSCFVSCARMFSPVTRKVCYGVRFSLGLWRLAKISSKVVIHHVCASLEGYVHMLSVHS